MKEKFGIRQFIIYLVVILLTLSCLIPLMNVISLSFSSSQAVASNKVGLLLLRMKKLLMMRNFGVRLELVCLGLQWRSLTSL